MQRTALRAATDAARYKAMKGRSNEMVLVRAHQGGKGIVLGAPSAGIKTPRSRFADADTSSAGALGESELLARADGRTALLRKLFAEIRQGFCPRRRRERSGASTYNDVLHRTSGAGSIGWAAWHRGAPVAGEHSVRRQGVCYVGSFYTP